MTGRNDAAAKAMGRLLKFLAKGEVLLAGGPEGAVSQLVLAGGETLAVPASLLAKAVSLGLVAREGPDRESCRLAPPAKSYLRRLAAERDEAFLEQHGDIETVLADIDGTPQPVRIDRAESPLSALARLKEKSGAPFLPQEAMAAGEHLFRDFTRGHLQPRVTASWEPRLSSRANGSRGGMADLTDSAMAARNAVNRAIEAMGPELSGVAVDICCFMKGLEVVERERQWPARSAKLMLRTALLALSRHYDPPVARGRMQHWGAEGFRPEM